MLRKHPLVQDRLIRERRVNCTRLSERQIYFFQSPSTQKSVNYCLFSWMFELHSLCRMMCLQCDTRRLFSNVSAERGNFLCAHLKSLKSIQTVWLHSVVLNLKSQVHIHWKLTFQYIFKGEGWDVTFRLVNSLNYFFVKQRKHRKL